MPWRTLRESKRRALMSSGMMDLNAPRRVDTIIASSRDKTKLKTAYDLTHGGKLLVWGATGQFTTPDGTIPTLDAEERRGIRDYTELHYQRMADRRPNDMEHLVGVIKFLGTEVGARQDRMRMIARAEARLKSESAPQRDREFVKLARDVVTSELEAAEAARDFVLKRIRGMPGGSARLKRLNEKGL